MEGGKGGRGRGGGGGVSGEERRGGGEGKEGKKVRACVRTCINNKPTAKPLTYSIDSL